MEEVNITKAATTPPQSPATKASTIEIPVPRTADSVTIAQLSDPKIKILNELCDYFEHVLDMRRACKDCNDLHDLDDADDYNVLIQFARRDRGLSVAFTNFAEIAWQQEQLKLAKEQTHSHYMLPRRSDEWVQVSAAITEVLREACKELDTRVKKGNWSHALSRDIVERLVLLKERTAEHVTRHQLAQLGSPPTSIPEYDRIYRNARTVQQDEREKHGISLFAKYQQRWSAEPRWW